jgi:hypothetical protein
MATKQEEYQLVLRLPFKAMDDPAARQKAKQFLEDSGISEDMVVKLQKLQGNQPPVGLEL